MGNLAFKSDYRLALAPAAFFLMLCGFVNAAAQVRPTVIDSGDVKETKPASHVDRKNIGPVRVARPAFAMLVILTDPPEASVKINGVDEGKAAQGKFTKELPIGKKCTIHVSAGPDYQEFSKTVDVRSRSQIIEADLTYKYGTVKIFPAMDGVAISVDGKALSADHLQVDKENRILTLIRLAPGDHRITYDLPGYALYERSFNVSAGAEESWNFIPEKAVTDLSVLSDPDTTVYIDGAQMGETPGDGSLKVPDVKIGKHDIKLVKDGFEEYSESDEFEFHKPVSLAHKMVPNPTSAGFSDDFDVPNPSLWRMPASGCSIKNGRLWLEKTSGLLYPKDIVYRDFVMNFDLKLVNGGGAAWAVRVKDGDDYYLFYLSGPEGLFPNRFVTYIVKNGKFDPNIFSSSVNIPIRLAAGAEYSINVSGTQNSFVQTITPAATGQSINLGAFKDPDSVFPYGAIGFRTVGNESFSIDDLFVEPKVISPPGSSVTASDAELE